MLLFISNLYPLQISAEVLSCLIISDSNCIEWINSVTRLNVLNIKYFNVRLTDPIIVYACLLTWGTPKREGEINKGCRLCPDVPVHWENNHYTTFLYKPLLSCCTLLGLCYRFLWTSTRGQNKRKKRTRQELWKRSLQNKQKIEILQTI